jgi:hypothetical protein
MKRLISGLAAVGALLLMTVSAQASGAGAISVTQTFHNATQSFPSPQPCTGVPGVVNLTFNGVSHFNFLTSGIGAGTGWGTFTATGDVFFVGSDGVNFTGHFMTWDGQNFNLQNYAATATFVIHATGTDGTSLTLHEVAHMSVSASGVVVSFDKASCG